MADDITSLKIKVSYDDVTKAESGLKKLTNASKKNTQALGQQEKAVNSLRSGVAKLVVAYGSLRGVIRSFREIIRITAEFQMLNAQLVTATGSAADAAKAFEAVKDFAQQTPFDLQQATSAFISLVNRGLTPSEEALRSYGDTASSMGFALKDMVLAVSNATSGEFETLKRFGIRAKKEGEGVSFTFRGVTTTVRNSVREIEDYFIGLGQDSFGGGMERQMATLGGAFSNFGDAWEVMSNQIGEGGLAAAVMANTRTATAAVEDFTAYLASGALEAELDSWQASWEGWGEDFDAVIVQMAEGFSIWAGAGKAAADGLEISIVERIKLIPATVRYWIQRGALELTYLVQIAAAVGEGILTQIVAGLDATLTATMAYSKAIGEALINPIDTFRTGGQVFDKAAIATAEAFGKAGTVYAESLARADRKMKAAREANALMVKEVKDEFLDAHTNVNSLADESDALLAKHKKERAEREKNNEDRLKRFRIGGDGAGAGGKKKGSGSGGSGVSEWETLERDLRDQETLISESYARRAALIQDNTRAGSAYQAELQLSLTAKFQEEQQKRLDLLKQEPETMLDAYAQERALLVDAYEQRKDIILSATELTETEKLRMLGEAQQLQTAQLRKHEVARQQMALGLVSGFVGSIAAIAGAAGQKGAKIAKAAAIVQTTIKTYESATSAYASLAGIPYVGPVLGAAAAGAAVAAGLANVQKIRSQNVSAGSFAQGGIVAGSSFTGDRLTAGVNSGEMIINRSQQQQLFQQANGSAARGGVVIRVHNPPGVPQEAQARSNPDGSIDILLRKAAAYTKAELTQEALAGTGTVFPAYSATHGLQRAGTH